MRARAALAAVGLVVLAACTPEATEAERTVTVFGPYRGTEADVFAEAVAPFEEATGIDVRFLGSAGFAAALLSRVDDARPPDVAIVPQPGLVAELADQGLVLAPTDEVRTAMDDWLLPEAVELGRVGDELLGVPYRLFVKSLVWYPPALFEERGWSVPTTLDELDDLTRTIARTGLPPWCLGIDAFAASGYIVTDWVEDVLLRTAGPTIYDALTADFVDFTDPLVVEAFDVVSDLLRTDDHVLGGSSGMVRTGVFESVLGLLGPEPACAMHRNANLVTTFLPAGTEVDPAGDLDFFVMPGTEPDEPAPLVTAVELAVKMSDNPDADLLLAHLATLDGVRPWIDTDGFLGGRQGERQLQTGLSARVFDVLTAAEVIRPDGSDAMEPEFGTTPYWSAMVEWITGRASTADTLERLDLTRERLAEGAES